MKKLFILATAILSFATDLFAQQDATAKKILDELSAKTRKYTAITADFNVIMDNKKDKTTDTQKGKIQLKGNKYRLELNNQLVINDGKSSYTILSDAKEVQINPVDPKEHENGITPVNIFTVYEKGFKYQFMKEEKNKAGEVIQIINLYPEDLKKKKYHTAVLEIDKNKKQIKSLKILGKDGQDITYKVISFNGAADIPETVFTYNKSAYPGYEETDLR